MKATSTFLCAAIILGNLAFASSDDVPPSYALSNHQIMVKAAIEFHAPYELLRNIAKCESGISMIPIGSEGEIGAFQYKNDTFDGMSKAMGEKLDIHSIEDQSRLFAWVSVNKPEWLSQWSTWRVWYAKGLKRCRIKQDHY